jgi:hypothetical protein
MTDQRKIERALVDFFKSRKMAIRPDGLGDHHVVLLTNCPTVPNPEGGCHPLLSTRCPLMAQVGEDCGFDMERLNISELAKAIAES